MTIPIRAETVNAGVEQASAQVLPGIVYPMYDERRRGETASDLIAVKRR